MQLPKGGVAGAWPDQASPECQFSPQPTWAGGRAKLRMEQCPAKVTQWLGSGQRCFREPSSGPSSMRTPGAHFPGLRPPAPTPVEPQSGPSPKPQGLSFLFCNSGQLCLFSPPPGAARESRVHRGTVALLTIGPLPRSHLLQEASPASVRVDPPFSDSLQPSLFVASPREGGRQASDL